MEVFFQQFSYISALQYLQRRQAVRAGFWFPSSYFVDFIPQMIPLKLSLSESGCSQQFAAGHTSPRKIPHLLVTPKPKPIVAITK